MKTDKTVVLDTQFQDWNPGNPGAHYSVITRCLVRSQNVWRLQIKSHEVDSAIGWTGNYQIHTDQLALDGLERAVAKRKQELVHRRSDRVFSRQEKEKLTKFESAIFSRGFCPTVANKATRAYKRANILVRQMWHGGWRIDGITPCQTAASMEAVEASLFKLA